MMAADLHGLLGALAIERAHLVGHSYGGAVALHYALEHPERVRSLTLADASVPGLQPALAPCTSARWERLRLRLRLAGIEVADHAPRVAYSFLEDLARRRRAVRDTSPWGTGTPALAAQSTSRLARRWLQLMRSTTAAQELGAASGLRLAQLRRLNVPALAIDGQFSGRCATPRRLVANLPRCRKVVVPGGGHLFPMLRPARFVRALRRFVQSLEATTP